jgi:hypothetical protein
MLTLQQIYDKALAGIRKQGKPGYGAPERSARDTCRYRTPDRANPGVMLACGVGQLIPDDQYDPDFDAGDGVSVTRLLDNSRFKRAMESVGINVADPGVRLLLADLQAVHDGAAAGRSFMEKFERNMAYLAQRHGLTYTPPGA